MGYGLWGRSNHDRPFSEKTWNRKALAPWDAQWHVLSPEARRIFLAAIETGPPKSDSPASVPKGSAPSAPAHELVDRGFAVITRSTKPTENDRVAPDPKARDFMLRMRALQRYQLLRPDVPSRLVAYVLNGYYAQEGMFRLGEVVNKAGIGDAGRLEEIARQWVPRRYWPEWALPIVKAPWKEQLLEVIRAADQPLVSAELAAKLPEAKPQEVRAALDELVAYLVVFEDIQPETRDLVVGLLPDVRRGIAEAAQGRQRPPLITCPEPAEVAREGSLIVDDLRSFLLEVASEPPRLRQDSVLFAKEESRFRDCLEPQPRRLPTEWVWTPEKRIKEAGHWAADLKLVRKTTEGREHRLQLNERGQQWLGAGLAEQYSSVYKFLNALSQRSDGRPTYDTDTDEVYYPSYHWADSWFLGVEVVAIPSNAREKDPYSYWEVKKEHKQALRDALFRAFEALPIGVFQRIDSVVDHLSFGPDSPLNLGGAPARVTVFKNQNRVPNLEEEREEVARFLIGRFIRERLVPLGALRVAVDPEGNLCVARTPLLAAYFDRPESKIEMGAATAGDTRVVVQPDFSIIVIGLSSEPIAALTPFCERSTKQTGAGATVLKLTRESVVRAVGHGLPGNEILERIRKYASTEIPQNVLRELEGWCGWVRHVHLAPLTIVRCGDQATADRVLSALGKRAERLNDTVVALAEDRLTPAERAKLQNQGIIVQNAFATSSTKRPTKAK